MVKFKKIKVVYLNARSRFYQAHMIEKILKLRCKGYVWFCACVSEAKNVCKSYIERNNNNSFISRKYYSKYMYTYE